MGFGWICVVGEVWELSFFYFFNFCLLGSIGKIYKVKVLFCLRSFCFERCEVIRIKYNVI